MKKKETQNPSEKRPYIYSNFGALVPNSRVSVKLPEPYRDHWMLSARREKRSLSSVIVELLKEKYGVPTT